MCGHRNPMSLLRLRSHSHQSIPIHMLTIDDNQRDTYDSRMCLYCPSGVTGLEIHLILECPATSHVALDLITTLSSLWHLPTKLDYPDHPSTKLPCPRRPHIYPPQKNSSSVVEFNPPRHPWLCLSPRNSLVQHDLTSYLPIKPKTKTKKYTYIYI